jgi:Rrf2 family nitric oxide-sensitive transcriptional repressor
MRLAQDPERLVSIREISADEGLSPNSVSKAVAGLLRHGFLETVRGRAGGIRLARPPEEIKVSDVITHAGSPCRMANRGDSPELWIALDDAARAYMKVLNNWTLADVAIPSA